MILDLFLGTSMLMKVRIKLFMVAAAVQDLAISLLAAGARPQVLSTSATPSTPSLDLAIGPALPDLQRTTSQALFVGRVAETALEIGLLVEALADATHGLLVLGEGVEVVVLAPGAAAVLAELETA